ncbi:hypothetical protein Fmac_021450 [Flemingia macrophylla]|uniref:ADP-ribosyl cyclase/cyclic ADP-ribose hydrolase n=1 Tax=Flemingia macrophylla TaxID=520843 RepID=A0ABD1LXE1_9FABA
MACTAIQTSSASGTKSFDVFVSFRGEDTRNSFTNHLFAALQRKGVIAFKDDQKIKKGELLEPELLQAIEGSLVFIVVFSKDYSSSTWCLKELTKIVHWVEQTGRIVLPVFFDVTPSEVRKQSGQFGNAFVEHEKRFKDNLEMVQNWRSALEAITNRSGWDLNNNFHPEELVELILPYSNIIQLWEDTKVFLQTSLPLGVIKIVIPGTQIPQWISKQNVGSSISMDLSSVMDDPNWKRTRNISRNSLLLFKWMLEEVAKKLLNYILARHRPNVSGQFQNKSLMVQHPPPPCPKCNTSTHF